MASVKMHLTITSDVIEGITVVQSSRHYEFSDRPTPQL